MKIFSRHRFGSFLLVLLIVVALLGSGCDLFELGVEHLIKEFRRRHDFSGTVRLSNDKQKITSAVGQGKKVYQGTPREMASQFLNDHTDLLGLTAGLADLRLISEQARKFGANVEYQQIRNGLPVENGRIQINFDKDGHVVQVVNSYTAPAGALDQTNISKERAEETAINEFLRTTLDKPSKSKPQQKNPSGTTVSRDQLKLKEDPKIEDVYFSKNDRLHRAYRISINAERPFGIKQFVTDANSGEILYTKNFVYNWVDGQGHIFKPNPVKSLNNPGLFGDGEFTDVGTNNPNPYFTVPLRDLNASTGQFTLSGPFVVLEDIECDKIKPPMADFADGFKFFRNDDGFKDVMVYYHIDRMQRYIQTLGLDEIVNRPLRADAHGLCGSDNSHYVSLPEDRGYVAFSDGFGVDDAEDAEVIAHEYGHAIQDDQAADKYSVTGEPRAMGEGFGDYWAFSSYRDETPSGHNPHCLMEWDWVLANCSRRVDGGPAASSFNSALEEWENGRIWSTTLFMIFDSLGKNVADRLILQSHFNFSGSTFLLGADAIIAADVQLFAGANKTKLCEIFADRKIYNNKCS